MSTDPEEPVAEEPVGQEPLPGDDPPAAILGPVTVKGFQIVDRNGVTVCLIYDNLSKVRRAERTQWLANLINAAEVQA